MPGAIYLKILAVQALDASYSGERKGEAITARAGTMRLASEGRRCKGAGGVGEARGRGREAEVGLGEMQPSGIMPAPVEVFAAVGDVRGGDGQLGGDLKQGRLGTRETELALEEGGLGGVPVRVGQVQALHRIDQLLGGRLGLLDEAGEVEHDCGSRVGLSQPVVDDLYGR